MNGSRWALLLTPLCLLAMLALGHGGMGVAGAAQRTSDLREAIHADAWINTAPLDAAALDGKVVLVEFWTFACWNCKNVEPYVQRWHERYAKDGLVVIAVHTPEFDYERKIENVERYAEERGIEYPIAVDNTFRTWKAFDNYAWPSFTLLDADGKIRHRKVGEGGYAATEVRIQQLLAEAQARAE